MRIDALQAEIRRAGSDAALVTRPVAIGYLTGLFLNPHERFFALYVPSDGASTLFGPALEQANLASTGLRVELVADGVSPGGALRAAGLGTPRSLLVERDVIPLAWAADAAGALGQEVAALGDATPLVTGLRIRKDEAERERLREAARRLDQATEHARALVRPGITERQMADGIERYMREELGVHPGFPSIVLFGERSALPHGGPTDRALRPGDLVLVDIGVLYEGYVADTTRTFALGSLSDELRQVYAVVQEAQAAARAACRPGLPMGALDEAARRVIRAHGHGEHFTHRVGHGLGLEGHEEPYLVPGRPDRLLEGMCLTIEPGVYLPGVGGVRIEDDLIVTESGAETLTRFPRDLEVI